MCSSTIVLISILQYLTQKETALTVLDTHAGAGLYRLDSEFSETSGEAVDGVQRLFDAPDLAPAAGLCRSDPVVQLGRFAQGLSRLAVHRTAGHAGPRP